VGRYLYDLDSPWVEIEARGRSFVIPDREMARLRGMLRETTRPATSEVVSRGLSSTGETLKEKAYRIRRAMEIAARADVVNDILRVNAADLALIRGAGPQTYARLIAYAEQRKAELAAPPAENGSALAQKLRDGLVA
jgi:hypothetical protein